MKLNNTIYHLILTLVPSLVLSGCLGTEYYDVATDEIITPEGITNVIPTIDDLKKLYPGWHGYEQSEMTLFLEEPAN